MPQKKSIKQGSMGLSVKAFVVNEVGKFLTLRRTKTAPFCPLCWDLPGGDVEFGEDPERAILRELKEETGLKFSRPKLFSVEGHSLPSGNYWLTLAFTGRVLAGKLQISWEHDLFQWVTVDEFLKLKSSKKLKKFAREFRANFNIPKT